MKLTDVLAALRQWLNGIHIPAEILIDTDECLRVIFETKNALAELIAADGGFTPYRSVAFTVLDTRLDVNAEPVFCFWDDESHTIGDILRELDRGIGYLK